jgi:hypothetical protein
MFFRILMYTFHFFMFTAISFSHYFNSVNSSSILNSAFIYINEKNVEQKK